MGKLGLADFFVAQNRRRVSSLDGVKAMVNWHRIEKLLKTTLGRTDEASSGAKPIRRCADVQNTALTAKDGIMNCAYRNKPLTKHQQNRNLLISKKRYNVERVFGTLKKCYDLARSSYIGTTRVKANCCCHPWPITSNVAFFYGLHRRRALINSEKGSMDAERELKMFFFRSVRQKTRQN
jgi:IS5 family transposase